MSGKGWLFCGIAVAAAGAIYFINSLVSAQDSSDDAFSTWPPTAAAIQKALGPPNGRTNIPDWLEPRHKTFALMFQKRFRSHTPAVPIGLHFMGHNLMKVLCPARMEPWNMDRITLAAWKEAKQSFHQAYNIDIYLTYIGIPPVKVGEARPLPGHPGAIQIQYHFPHFYYEHSPVALGRAASWRA
ncbi:MAG TPA: hypothetical protein VGS41_15940 [Chthonomonadales bacterium]|nr:hypothetical protein [Chthonomonadales bacterium]